MADDDFDFFDEPVGSNTPRFNTSGVNDNHNVIQSNNSIHSAGKKLSNKLDDESFEKHSSVSMRKSGDYSSDGAYSDSFDEKSQTDSDTQSDTETATRPKSSTTVSKKIHARVPSALSQSESSDSESQRSSIAHQMPEKPYNKKNSFSDSETDSDSDTDSDVTDVSPLQSPQRNGKQCNGKPPKSPYFEGKTHKHAVNDNGRLDHDQMNLNLLMQAVMEMEKNKDADFTKNERIAKSRRVLFVPQKPASRARKNFSFQNERVTDIDKENQRLMEKILRYAADSSKAKKTRKEDPPKKVTASRVMTPSAVNRLREQQRIERENIALLKRLQHAKATPEIKRDVLLKDYEKKTIAGQSVASAHPSYESNYAMTMINKRSYSMNNLEGDRASVTLKGRGRGSRPSSASTYITGGFNDPATVTLTNKRNRPTSAKSVTSEASYISRGRKRPQSAHISQKPEWVN